ncbi:MAG: AIPR family protein [Myxococcota bacterium]
MTADDKRFAEYLDTLRSRIADEAIETADDTEAVAAGGFREDVFTQVLLATLEDLGQLTDAQVCFFERRLSRGIGKVNAWCLDEDEGLLTLVTTIFRGLSTPTSVPRSELATAIPRALQVYLDARRGWHSRMEPASEAYDMMQFLHESQGAIERVRVVALVDGFAADLGKFKLKWDGPEVQMDIWDLRRFFRAEASGLPYEPVEIDLVERLGQPLPCIASPSHDSEFEVYLAVIPGELLHELYHEHGSRLLELNVRSFLQARGKVNRGIRDTLKDEPTAFIAYNNGISATAEWVETTSGPDGLGLAKLRGLQVVNGGQTVASIHRAKERDKIDISKVFVQAKLTVVRPDQVEQLVPLISRYANTQNRVNEADFSANHPFHVKLQQLSQSIWAPGEQSRWFYERARGQYQVVQQRDGTTQAQLNRFKQANPPSQRFDKVSVAKHEQAWEQSPHVVSRGGQKSFVAFMQTLANQHGARWEPDAQYFKRSIAKAIIFKQAEQLARQHKFPAYRANAIAYTVAYVAHWGHGRIDLDRIWNEQRVSVALTEAMRDWMPQIYDALILSAAGRNVTEWCKKQECWAHVRALDLAVPGALAAEVSERAVVGGAHGMQA